MNIKDFYKKKAKRVPAKPGKYRNVPVLIDGIRFASKEEGKYYLYLKNDKNVHHFLRQTPFHLPGGVRYYLDFLVFYGDGAPFRMVHVDVKGIETPVFKIKKRQVEEIYRIKIETP